MPVPIFDHDCDACILIDSIEHPVTKHHHDVYLCPREVGGPSIIGRYGDEGWEYRSFTAVSAAMVARDFPGGFWDLANTAYRRWVEER